MTRQTHLQATTRILPMTVITDASDVKRRSTGKMTRHTHLRAMILILPNDIHYRHNGRKNKEASGKGSGQTMRNFNDKIADDIV